MSRTATTVRRPWLALLRMGHLVMFLSLLPSLLYLGHWSSFVAPGRVEGMSRGEQEAHEGHCHFGSGSCSEQPPPANLRALETVVELPRLNLQATLMEDSSLLVDEAIVMTPKEPPRV